MLILYGVNPANREANQIRINIAIVKPTIPRTNPAVAFPLESSFTIPSMPKMIAIAGIKNPIIDTRTPMLGIPNRRLYKLLIETMSAIAALTGIHINPKINAVKPNVFPIFFTTEFF